MCCSLWFMENLCLCIHPQSTQDCTLVLSDCFWLMCVRNELWMQRKVRMDRGTLQHRWTVGEEGAERKTGTCWDVNVKTIRCQRRIVSFSVQIGSWYWQHTLLFRANYVLKFLHLSKSGVNKMQRWKWEQSGKSCVCKDSRVDTVLPVCVGRISLPSFSPCELECLTASLSNTTGVFEYSGQEVKNTLLHLHCSAHATSYVRASCSYVICMKMMFSGCAAFPCKCMIWVESIRYFHDLTVSSALWWHVYVTPITVAVELCSSGIRVWLLR